MKRLAVKVCLAAVALLSADAQMQAQTAARGMTVFVTTARKDTRDDKEARKIQSSKDEAANKAHKDLEKTLKAQHGGKRGKWPKEAQEAYAEAEEAVAEANADWIYRRHQEKLAD